MRIDPLIPDRSVHTAAAAPAGNDRSRATAPGRRRRTPTLLAAFIFFGFGLAVDISPGAAHEFTVAIVGGETVADALVAEVTRGFIVATDEHDGHAEETSDGHLGGLDVQIDVLPETAAVAELVGEPMSPADIAFLLGPEPSAQSVAGSVLSRSTIRFGPGELPTRRLRDASDFAERFGALFGRPPTEPAEQGYNAARRIDLALRSRGGFRNRPAIEAALAESAAGIAW